MGQTLISLLLCVSVLWLSSAADTTNLVFKGCSTQKVSSPTLYSSLDTLLSSLSSLSSSANFHRTTAGDFSGVFQCRSDLSLSDCSKCVNKTPKLVRKFCPQSAAARVQLSACYIQYQTSAFAQTPGMQFLYKVCGSGHASGSGFGNLLRSALRELVKGVNGTGYYAGDYESVYVLGQCEGDLEKGDCVDCVKSAVDRAESDCGSSSSGQIYLQKCYISYYSYPNGVRDESGSSGGRGKNTQKTIAIVVGAVAGFGLLIAVLMFLKSAFKKRDSKY